MKLLRRNLVLCLLIAGLLTLYSPGVAAAPEVSAYSAVVMDGDTGGYYYVKDADTMRAPASMTKLMTAYVIFEELDAGRLKYDTPIPVSSHAAAVARVAGYSNVPLAVGETYTVDTMLRLMLLPSACGACVAMADYISGSEGAFAQRMNTEAAKIGMTTAFANSHGAVNHYVTPRSMAILAYNFVQKHPGILKYTSMGTVTFKGRTYSNTNHFLNSDYYAGVDGMKTGTNSLAGSCITVSAVQNGRRVIVVVMHSANRYADARKLLDYGFSKINEGNVAAKNATFDLQAKREKIRLGADFPLELKVSHGGNSFMATGGWTVNGTTVKTFGTTPMGNGTVLPCSLNLDAYAGSDVVIGAFINLPDGSVKTVTQEYAFSDETPCAFRDIDGHWGESAISSLKELKVLNGYKDGSFAPEGSITRAEFITALTRLMENEGKVTLVAGAESSFTDTNGHWADHYIAAAQSIGIAKGYEDNRFAPDAQIARQEVAVLLCRAYALTTVAPVKDFTDEQKIDDWAKESVKADVANGLIGGYPDGRFDPHRNTTRAEAIKILYKASLL